MQIILNNGHTYTLTSISKDQISKDCELKDIYKIIEDMTQENVSGATVKNDSNIIRMGNLKLSSFSAVLKENMYNLTIFFEEISESEIELAHQREKMEALRNIIELGLNHSDPEDVVRWCEFLPEWNGNRFPYRKGERFKYKDKPYEVIGDVVSSTTKTPDQSPALYKEVTKENKPAYPEYIKGKEYNSGDKVIYQGDIYECTWDKNTREPTGLGWKKI